MKATTLFIKHYRPVQLPFSFGSHFSLKTSTSRLFSQNVRPVSVASRDITIQSFRRTAFTPETPLLIQDYNELPATKKWFHQDESNTTPSFSSHFSQHHKSIFPYELVRSSPTKTNDNYVKFQDWLYVQGEDLLAQQIPRATCVEEKESSEENSSFWQFFAPLSLLVKAAEYNELQENANRKVKQLYIAQSQLDELPESLKSDLHVPDIVQFAGKGDIYDSSIWLGLEPTYTPLHRDPNPNLFFQMVSSKAVRLLPPGVGQQLYFRVQQQLGFNGNSRFRGTEMMEGRERAALYEAVWGSELLEDMQEAIVTSGDSLFIPKGWWHSIRSVYDDGRLNASVNWWFR